jgi:hypothetical protein
VSVEEALGVGDRLSDAGDQQSGGADQFPGHGDRLGCLVVQTSLHLTIFRRKPGWPPPTGI